MGASKRGFRSILSGSRRIPKQISKSSYTNLADDSGATPTVSDINLISVNVTVLTSADATPELECINGAETHPDKTIDDIDSNSAQEKREVEEQKEEQVAEKEVQENVKEQVQEQVQIQVQEQEEKESEDYNVFEATRRAAILMVQSASSMTDMMATTLASKSITPETASQEATTLPQESVRVKTIAEEKIEVEMDDTDFERELHKKVEEACRWGKERVDNALTKTHEVATDLVENSLSLGEAAMVSTETCSRAAFADGLALSPVLKQKSERLEIAYESAVAEVQEFLLEHWAKLSDYIVARYYHKTTTPQKAPDDTALHVAIEVHMTTRK